MLAFPRALAERHGLSFLVLLSILLLLLGKADIKAMGYLREAAGDAARLVLVAMRGPLASVRDAADRLGRLLAIAAENERLREENRRLLGWQGEAIRLAVENEALRGLLRMPPVEDAPLRTAARVVADPGGSFVHTRLVDAGADRGLRPGMAVVDEHGMVGRIIEVGERSARVLLLTDFNSKVPVIVDRTRDHAILEGTNGPRPVLRFLPLNPSFAVGDRVLTSGRGGLLPAGLLVGRIAAMEDGEVLVAPAADWDRLDHVGVLDYRAVEPPDGGQGVMPRVAGGTPASGARP